MITNRHLVDPACFDVTTEPVFGSTESGLVIQIPGIEDYKAVVRSKDRQVLGVSTTKYGVLPNQQAFDMVFDAIEKMGLNANVVDCTMNGKLSRVRATIEFPDIQVDPGDGHKLVYRAVISNSYDGGTQFGFQHGAFRLVCTNGMIIGTMIENFQRRHTENLHLNFEEVLHRFHKIVAMAPTIMLDGTQKFLNTSPKLQAAELSELLANVGKIPAKYTKGFMEKMVGETGFINWWDAYNAYTDMISHDGKGKASSFRKDQLLGNVHSVFSRLVNQGRERSLELLEEVRAA
jgi:hypothetical protein